jgi:hypothetical protein
MIELLESRIAPANIAITTTPDGGYNIVGTDSPDELRIEGIEPGVIQIRNENGTVTVNGSEEVTVANLPVPRGLVMIDLAGGDDFALLISLNFRRDLIINLGDGADLLSINELNVARTLRISGGAGSDQLIVGQTITVGRDLEVDLGLGM